MIVNINIRIFFDRITEAYDKFELTVVANSTKSKRRSTNPFLSDFEDIESTSIDNKESTSNDEDCNNSEVSLEYQMKRIHELKQQKKLYKNIIIHGIPKNSDENLDNIFQKICHCLSADITRNDIVSIYRVSTTKIVVKFVMFPAKTRFLKAYKSKAYEELGLMSREIFETESIEGQYQIFIDNHLTKWYAAMLMRAKWARRDGLIYAYWLTGYGLAVLKSENAITEHCLSTEDLDYVIYGL